MSYDAWCMGCKTTRPIAEARVETMRNGRPATRGVCGTCGTELYLLGDATKQRGRLAPNPTARHPLKTRMDGD